MSFGKQDGHLAKIGGYGATQTQQMGNASRRQSGPRKGSPVWANNFQPSEGSPDYIRLIPGEYDAERIDETSGQLFMESVPWFEYTEHYHGTNKSSITCSGGVFRMTDRKKAKPCRGCDIWREDFDERKRIEQQSGIKPQGPNRISFSSKYVFLVLDMAWFFKGYRLDEHGRVRVNKNTNQPYTDWIKYNQEHHNEYLYASGEAARSGKQLEMRNGMVQTWPLGFTQFGTLSGFADVVQKHCRSCGNQNCISTTGWACPTCNAPSVETTLSQEDLKKLVSKTLRCRHCNNIGYPKAIQQCGYCPNPQPANLYDVDMQVQTVKVNKTRQLIFPWMSAPRQVDQTYSDALKKLPDVLKKFSPTSYEEQIAMFGHPANQGQAPAPHGQQPQQGPQQGPPQHNYQTPAFGQPPQGNWPPIQPMMPAQPAQQWGQQPQQPQWGQQPQQQWGQAPNQWPNSGNNGSDNTPF